MVDDREEVLAIAILARAEVAGTRRVAAIGDELAGQPVRQPVVRQADAREARPRVGLGAVQPRQLRDRERGDRHRAARVGPRRRAPELLDQPARVGCRFGVVPELGGPDDLVARRRGRPGRAVVRRRTPRRRRTIPPRSTLGAARPTTPSGSCSLRGGVVGGCGALPRPSTSPVSASRSSTLVDWVDESTPSTIGIAPIMPGIRFVTMQFDVIASGYGLVEGPTIAPDGGVYFSDVLGGGVYRVGAVRRRRDRRPEATRRRWHRGARRRRHRLLRPRHRARARRARRPRCSPSTGSSGGTTSAPMRRAACTRVHCASPCSIATRPRCPASAGASTRPGDATELYGDVVHANGIALSPDDRTLYHSDTRSSAVIVHTLTDDGTATDRRVIDTSPVRPTRRDGGRRGRLRLGRAPRVRHRPLHTRRNARLAGSRSRRRSPRASASTATTSTSPPRTTPATRPSAAASSAPRSTSPAPPSTPPASERAVQPTSGRRAGAR